MQEKTKLARYEIVVLDPDTVVNKVLAGCCMVVVDRHPWGAMGYVQAPGDKHGPAAQTWYRAAWPEMLSTGGRTPLMLDKDPP